jgi:tetratricopeptide (TPR) repeat protein
MVLQHIDYYIKCFNKKNIVRQLLFLGFIYSLGCQYHSIITPPKPCDCCIINHQKHCPPDTPFLGDNEDYYRCARLATRCGNYEEALDYLNKAIQDNNLDSLRSTVHGMHFIPYFPHREKGIVLFHLKQYAMALKELNISINQETSDKAIYYRDSVRRHIQLEKKIQSIPKIIMEPLPAITRNNQIILSGTAIDKNYIDKISLINDQLFPNKKGEIFISQSQQKIQFNQHLFPEEGQHRITIEAKNLIGKISSQVVFLTVDRSGPVISVTSSANDLSICGSIADACEGITWCINNGPKQKELSKRVEFCASRKHGNISIKAWDRLGNLTQANLSPPNNSKLIAQAQPTIFYEYSSLVSQLSAQPLVVEIDNFPHQECVWYESTLMTGVVRSVVPIHSLAINNKTLISSQKISQIHFSRAMKLKPGKNTISIRAVNTDAQVIEKKLLCYRMLPQAFQNKHNYPIQKESSLFLSTEYKEHAKKMMKMFYHQLINSNRFLILNNGIEEQINYEKIKHHKYIPNAHVKGFIEIESKKDEQLDVTIGMRFIINYPVHQILIFDAFKTFPKNELSINYSYLIHRLNKKINRYFQRFQGNVIKTNSKEIILNWETNNGKPKKNLPLHIIRPIPMYSKRTGFQIGNDWVIVSTCSPKMIDYHNRKIVVNCSGYVGDGFRSW